MVKKAKRPPADPSTEVLGRRVCGNCYHFERFADSAQSAGADISGECQWKPPTVLGIDESGLVVQASPIRSFRNRCGQHQPQVN